MYPRCCRINFGFYSSTLVDKEPRNEKVDYTINLDNIIHQLIINIKMVDCIINLYN